MKSFTMVLSFFALAFIAGCGSEYPLTSEAGSGDPAKAGGAGAADTFVWSGEKTLPQNLTIPPAAAYCCAPGTQLILPENATVTVKGSLIMSGTEASPVRIFSPSTATILVKGKLKAVFCVSAGSGGTLITGAGGACILDDFEAQGYGKAIGGIFSSLCVRNAVFNRNDVAVSMEDAGLYYIETRLSSLTLSGVRITGAGRQSGVGLLISGALASGADVLLDQMLFTNLKCAVSYAVIENRTAFTAVNVTVKNCIDGFAPLTPQAPGFDTLIVSNSDIATRNPAVSLTQAQGSRLFTVEFSNIGSKTEPPVAALGATATTIRLNQAALLDGEGKAYGEAEIYERVADSGRIATLVLDTVPVAGRGAGYDFIAADSALDTMPAPAPRVPAAPVVSAAASGDGSVTLSWSLITGATAYNVYFAAGTSVTKNDARVSQALPPKTVSGLSNGTWYAFAVSAVNAAGESELSAAAAGRPLVRPMAPVIASVVPSDGSVTVAWNAVPFADSYILYFQKGAAADTSSAAFTGAVSPKIVAGLHNGARYAFAVQAINSMGRSDLSAPDTAVPAGVPGSPVFSAVSPADGAVTLSWLPVPGATAYNVYYAAGDTARATDAKIAGALSPRTISGLVNGTRYAFALSAENGITQSPLGASVTATPHAPATAPVSPTGVVATAGNGSATVSWSQVAGALSYKLYYTAGTTVDKAAASFADATSPKTIPGLANGAVYAFAVCAVGAAGESSLSAVATATPMVVPEAPSITEVAAADGTVMVSWNPVALATSYTLYYAAGASVDKTGLKLVSVTSPYSVRALSNGTSYAFAVAAANGSGESALSAPAIATPGVPPPSAPQGITGAPSDSAEVTVAWNPVAGASSYTVYYAQGTAVDTTGARLHDASSPKTIGALTPGVPWTFRVAAINAGGRSALSAPVTVTPEEGSGAK
jgi:hypothetical protein